MLQLLLFCLLILKRDKKWFPEKRQNAHIWQTWPYKLNYFYSLKLSEHVLKHKLVLPMTHISNCKKKGQGWILCQKIELDPQPEKEKNK